MAAGILIVLAVIFGIIIMALLWGVGVYNGLVKLKNIMLEAWSGVDVQLKKRYDLIPNLLETVKGYASHEKELFENVTKARANAQQADGIAEQQAAEKSLQSALVNVFAVAEAYPDLKANENFQQLQTELSVIEKDIEMARRYYNGSVRDYNTKIESFPSNLIAGAFKFDKAEFFEIENAAERAVPKVEF